jgi:hypothetical protein
MIKERGAITGMKTSILIKELMLAAPKHSHVQNK